MVTKVKINKDSGELYIKSSSSREQTAVILKKIEGIVSFPIKIEEVNGNKDAKTIYNLYYDDTLLQECVSILSFDTKEDAVIVRKAIEKAYEKTEKPRMSSFIKNTVGIMAILCLGKYLLIGSDFRVAKEPVKQQVSNPYDSTSGSNYNREELMNTVDAFKKQKQQEQLQQQGIDNSSNEQSNMEAMKALEEKGRKEALQRKENSGNIEKPEQTSSDDQQLSGDEKGETQGQQFADFLNGKDTKK